MHTHDFFRFPHTPHIAWLAQGIKQLAFADRQPLVQPGELAAIGLVEVLPPVLHMQHGLG